MKKLPDDEYKLRTLNAARPLHCDAEHKAQAMTDFSAKTASVLGGAKTFARILETTDSCIPTRAKQEPEVSAFLRKY